MFRSLASILLLGMFPHVEAQQTSYILPDITYVSVAAPSPMQRMPVVPAISASGAMLIDITSGETIYAKDALVSRPMGSLTKLMTALIIVENHDMNEIVRIPAIAANQKGSAIGVEAGQQFRLGDLMYALLMPSANDVAYALAVHHSESVSAFVDEMNKRAVTLGLKGTHFANPAGFDAPEQSTTPRDIAWLSAAALKQSVLKEIVHTRFIRIFSRDGLRYDLNNTNELLHSRSNVFGMKTGTTANAGECLATYFIHNERPYLLVLLGSQARYTDAIRVMDAMNNIL